MEGFLLHDLCDDSISEFKKICHVWAASSQPNLTKSENISGCEYINTENDSQGGRITPPRLYACVLARRGYSPSGL